MLGGCGVNRRKDAEPVSVVPVWVSTFVSVKRLGISPAICSRVCGEQNGIKSYVTLQRIFGLQDLTLPTFILVIGLVVLQTMTF